MGNKWIAGLRAAGLALGTVVLMIAPADAQELSERSVKTFMDYAWSLTPSKFTKPDGTSVEVEWTDGTASTTSRASSVSISVGAPYDVPRAACSVIARTTAGCACPRISGPHEST